METLKDKIKSTLKMTSDSVVTLVVKKSHNNSSQKLLTSWIGDNQQRSLFVKQNSISVQFFLSNLIAKGVKEDALKLALDNLYGDSHGTMQIISKRLWASSEKIGLCLPDTDTLLYTSPLLRNLIRLAGLKNLTLAISKEDSYTETVDQGEFWKGFFNELYSDNTIKRIAPISKKSTMYAAGISCMRLELFNLIKLESKIKGTYFTSIDPSVIGSSVKPVSKKFLTSVASGYKNSNELLKTLSFLIGSYFKTKKESIYKRFDWKSFLLTSSQVLSKINRVKSVKIAKGRKGRSRQTTVKKVIRATKPSRLATVMAVERNYVSELFESSWTELEHIKAVFDKTMPLKRNYDDFIKKVRSIIKKEWEVKQAVLNFTKPRIAWMLTEDEMNKSQNERLATVRNYCNNETEISKDNIEVINYLLTKAFAYLKLKDDKGFSIASVTDFLSAKKLSRKYPHTKQMCEVFTKSLSTFAKAKVDSK